MNAIGDFITNQIFKMDWLSTLILRLIQALFGSGFAASAWGQSLHFLIYDFIKISLLLFILIFVVSFIQSYFPPEKTKKILAKYHGFWANVLGALMGTVTPFCSCSSIPIFIGFTRAGLASGITFSFLISSPLVDLASLVLLASIFGWKIAIVYVVIGLILAVIGGTIIEKSGLGEEIAPFVRQGIDVAIESPKMKASERLRYGLTQAWVTYRKVVLYLLIGVLVGALIHNWIPTDWIQWILGQQNPFSVLIATVVGTPIYADIFGTLPIAEALYAKGIGIGTILAFMMAVTALSLPQFILLKKVMKARLLVTFFAIVMAGIVIIGYAMNALAFLFM